MRTSWEKLTQRVGASWGDSETLVEITSMNHGFAVDAQCLQRVGGQVTHVNLNDGTVEGIRHRELAAWSVQYHPESSAGPHDSDHLFDRSVRLMHDTREAGHAQA